MDEVEHEVILHCDVEGLHLLCGVSASRDGAGNSVFALHERVILGMDLVDNVWSVDGIAVLIPVDSLSSLLVSVLVVVIKN